MKMIAMCFLLCMHKGRNMEKGMKFSHRPLKRDLDLLRFPTFERDFHMIPVQRQLFAVHQESCDRAADAQGQDLIPIRRDLCSQAICNPCKAVQFRPGIEPDALQFAC